MADNPTLPSTGTGTAGIIAATDQIPGTLEHYQKMKLADGTADSTTMITGTTPGDASAGAVGLWVDDQLMVFNGTNWDRARAIASVDAAPNVDTGILAVGNGPGWDRKRNPSDQGTVVGNTSVFTVDGASVIQLTILTSTTGTFAIEVSGDDSAFINTEAYNVQLATLGNTSQTPTNGATYLVKVGGWRKWQLRTQTTLGATMSFKWTGSQTAWPFTRIQTAAGTYVPAANWATGDGQGVNVSGLAVGSFPFVYNGSQADRLRAVAALDAAPNVDTGILAVGYGPGWDRKQNPANLGTATNSAITVVNDGADVVTFAIGTATTGTFIFEVTDDDTNWYSATILDPATELWQYGTSITPAANKNYMVRTGGHRQVRIRTNATLGATVAVKWTGHAGRSELEAPFSASDNTYLASAARTTTQTMADQTNVAYSGILVITDMTTVGTGSITPTVQFKDPASAKYININTGTAITTNITQTIRIFPGQTAGGALTDSLRLPRTWRILVTANNANSATYSVGYVLLP